MKKIILIVAILWHPGYSVAEEWSKGDTLREAGFAAIVILDWGSTIGCQPNWVEKNPLLGKHPTDLEISTYMLSTIVIHAGISYILSQPWREIWQYVTIGIEIGPVAGNLGFGTGLRIGF